jgi:nicotinamidase-related amidase
MITTRATLLACALLTAAAFARADILDEWASVKAPPPVQIKPVKIDSPQTTALLVMDFVQRNCGERPRCVATMPAVSKFLARARAANLLVIYTTGPGGKITDTLPQVQPLGNEPVFTTNADKFFNTGLEQLLKDKGIKTVITIGTAANGAVVFTATGAAVRGYNVIVPLDGMSSDNTYPEQFVAWQLANGAGSGPRTTMTRFDMISF